MATFEAGSWVWIPSEEEMYVPAKVLSTFKAGDPGKVQTEDGEDVSLTPDQSKECKAWKINSFATRSTCR